MKLKTVYSSKLEKWHDYFLWFPKKVTIKESEDEYSIALEDVEVSFLWLETVKRRFVGKGVITKNNDNFFYWKKP